MEDCIFCKIIRGEIPCEKIYEDDETLAFLSIGPNNPGHTLVIPKFHSENIYEMSDEAVVAMSKTTRTVAKAVKAGTSAHGINIIMNNEPAAGQVIFHTHMHVIPRFADDGLKHWPEGSYKEGESEAVAEKIRAALHK